jgi:hypothetical protein
MMSVACRERRGFSQGGLVPGGEQMAGPDLGVGVNPLKWHQNTIYLEFEA